MQIADVMFLILDRASSRGEHANWSEVPRDGCSQFAKQGCTQCRWFTLLMLTVSAAWGGVINGVVEEQLKIEFFSLIQYFQMEPHHSLSDSSGVLKYFVQVHFLNKRQSFLIKHFLFFQYFFTLDKDLFVYSSLKKLNKHWKGLGLCLCMLGKFFLLVHDCRQPSPVWTCGPLVVT